MTDTEAFINALKQARLADAAKSDAAANLHDARVLRLEAMRDALLPQLNMNDQARSLFDLVVLPGEKPRLWLDLISSIEMEPDSRTYRLMQGKETARECLFETADAAQMKNFALKYCAHRLISQDKKAANTPLTQDNQQKANRYTLWDMIYVWFTGILLGALGLVAFAISHGIIEFRR